MAYVDCKFAGDAPVDLIKAKIVRARIDHECDMLGCAINPGDQYLMITGSHKGEVSTRRYCAKCGDLQSNAKDQRRDSVR